MDESSTIPDILAYTPEQFAERAGISLQQLEALINTGKIGILRLGSSHTPIIRIPYTQFQRLAALDVSSIQVEPEPEPEPQPPIDEYESFLLHAKATSGVYLLQMEAYFKIGCSDKPQQRIAALTGSLPVRPVLLALMETYHYQPLEYTLHTLYAHKRLNGEWFRLVAQDIKDLQALNACIKEHRLEAIRKDRQIVGWRFHGATRTHQHLYRACQEAVSDK